jgi:DNA-binding transcriptional ArsR family regulator
VNTYQSGPQLDALGDPTRRAIFERLAKGPLAVVEIARTLPVSRPAVSQHLKVLKDVGLVMDRPEGTRRLYAIDRVGVACVRDYFDRFWDTALDAFRRAAEQSHIAESPESEDRLFPETKKRKKKESKK